MIATETPEEALLLENTLIKKERPPYNLRLKDDKSYLLVRVDRAHPFPRLRLGIGEPEGPFERFVLAPFPPAEREAAGEAVARAAEAVRQWIRLGGERAMGEVNRRDLDPPAERA